jgi:hypothetical protein
MPNGTAAADAFDPEPEQEEARPRDHRPRDAKAGRGQASGAATARCLQVLGVAPNAALDAINTAYFTFIKRFPENPTEEDEARLQDVKRAYDMLRRTYQPKVEKPPRVQVDKRVLIPLMALTSVALAGVLVAFNWKTIRLKMVHYESGTVLTLKGQGTPFGQVIGYESSHHFETGNPSGAYQLRLQEGGQDVWVGERLVVNGMMPVAASK